MEELAGLAGGEDELRRSGWEYILAFLDWFPEAPQLNPAASLMSPSERAAVAEVLVMICQFADEAGAGASGQELLELKWANRIAPFARNALEILNLRGRFNEDLEEEEPSAGAQPF